MPLINDWLKEILANMHISATFTLRLIANCSGVQFDAPVIESADEERLVFSSLVSLLMQFLRHKERKRLNGLRIGIYSTR